MIRPQYSAQVGYDVDETLWHGVGDSFRDFLVGQRHPFNEEKFQTSGGSWNEATGYLPVRLSQLYTEYLRSKMCPDPIPIPGAYNTLDSLRNVVTAQHIVTARSEATRPKTIDQLEKHFPLCITRHWFQSYQCKYRAIGTHGIDIFVEDSFEEAEIILDNSDHPVWVILFVNFVASRAPQFHHERLIRLPIWDEIKPGIPRRLRRGLWRQAWRETHHAICTLLQEHYPLATTCSV